LFSLPRCSEGAKSWASVRGTLVIVKGTAGFNRCACPQRSKLRTNTILDACLNSLTSPSSNEPMIMRITVTLCFGQPASFVLQFIRTVTWCDVRESSLISQYRQGLAEHRLLSGSRACDRAPVAESYNVRAFCARQPAHRNLGRVAFFFLRNCLGKSTIGIFAASFKENRDNSYRNVIFWVEFVIEHLCSQSETLSDRTPRHDTDS